MTRRYSLPQGHYHGRWRKYVPARRSTRAAGCIPIDEAAHARLRAFWQAEQAKQAERAERSMEWSAARRSGRQRIHLTIEQLREAAARHEAGESWQAIAARYQVGMLTLIQRMREAGYRTGRTARVGSEAG